MGLSLAPTFRIIANQADITATIRDRLVSLRVTDEAGVQSDEVELVLADHDPARSIRMPSTGAELEVWIGYDGGATRMGLYIVDEVELSGPPRQMRIAAKASPHEVTPTGITALHSQRSRSWPVDTTIGDMVAVIADDHGLAPAVAEALAVIALPHVDQTNESDMNLLTRIARDHDAIAKPGGGRLLMVKRGAALTASGLSLGVTQVAYADVSRWSMLTTRRPPAASVVAVYRNHGAADDEEIVVGEGDPVRRLPHTYANKSNAKNAAEAELDKSKRAADTVRLTMVGRPGLIAEAPIALTGFRPGVDGRWSATRVEHLISESGYSTSVEAETPG